MDETRKYLLEWGNPNTKEHTWYALTDKWIFTQKHRIPKIQFTHQKNLKNEDQSMDTLVLLRRENKIHRDRDTEPKYEAKAEVKTIQRLSLLGTHPIKCHQTQTLLWMPTSACCQEPDTDVFREPLPVTDKYRGGCSWPTIELSTGYPVEKLEKGSKELKGFAAP